MKKSRNFVRQGLINGDLPFGVAVKMNSRYQYYINETKFLEFMGITKNSKVVKDAQRITRARTTAERMRRNLKRETAFSSN